MELHGLQFAPNVIGVIKSRKMRFVAHVEGTRRNLVYSRNLNIHYAGVVGIFKECSRSADGVVCIHLSQDVTQWLPFVQTVLNLRDP